MKKVYIASPYSGGSQEDNVQRQIMAFYEIQKKGMAPFAPLLWHFVHEVYPIEYDKWLDLGMEWLRTCDCLLRLSGQSNGADKEVEEAQKLGIPIFYSLEELEDN